MTAALIERGFVRLPAGRVHYRFTAPSQAAAPPLYMAHAGPGCSRGLEPLIAALGVNRRVVAPDMLGNGDSDPPDVAEPDIGWYVARAVETMDRLGLERVDFLGDHTGAQIGAELAVLHPRRVRRLVLDGAPLFPPEIKAEFLARYAPPVSPDDYGGHLAWAWRFVSSLALHFPHYRMDPAHRLNAGPVPPPEVRHALAVDILKALPTYHLAYRAAFSHDTAACLPQVKTPTLLIAADSDPLVEYLEAAAALVQGSRHARVTRDGKASAIRAFLDEPATS